VDDHTLLVAAIDGMISKLDPWSVFLDDQQAQMMDDSAKGRYGGIGVNLNMNNGRILVNSVFPDSPAEKAGVKDGDLITEVDGKPVRGRKIADSLEALTGEPGTPITVRVKTPGLPSRELTLERDYILISSVNHELLDGQIGYFEITHFHRNTHSELQRNIETLQRNTNAPLSGIILDLRNNGGGVVLPAVEMADGFLDEGMIVYTQGRYEASLLEFRANPGQWADGVPLVILVDGKTASASEVFAGALQDHGRALIMGEKTFGKGSIQSVFRLRNGSMLKLTTAHYFTPLGRTIHENGIEPDIIITPEYDDSRIPGNREEDPLVQRAISHLAELNAG
jgi:carboxyl-terminal processing protease